MRIKKMTMDQLTKKYNSIKHSNPIVAGFILARIRKLGGYKVKKYTHKGTQLLPPNSINMRVKKTGPTPKRPKTVKQVKAIAEAKITATEKSLARAKELRHERS